MFSDDEFLYANDDGETRDISSYFIDLRLDVSSRR